jgi:hypothetical protein
MATFGSPTLMSAQFAMVSETEQLSGRLPPSRLGDQSFAARLESCPG